MKTIDIVLIMAFIVLCFFICDKVNAESATITFTDAVDLEARVDSIGAVCDTVIADTLCVLFDHKDEFVLAYRDSAITCRSIEWVAVTRHFSITMVDVANTITDFGNGLYSSTLMMPQYEPDTTFSKALVVWREETR